MAKDIQTKAPEQILLRNDETDEPRKDKFYNKEVSIKLNLRSISKVGLIVIVLLGVFMLGRFSADTDFMSGVGLSGALTADVTTPEVKAEPTKVVEETKPTVTEPVKKDVPIEKPKETEVKATEKIVEKEEIVTEYNNVEFTLENVEFDWMDTWGKMTGLELTIINNEDGTIQPDELWMSVKGYDDFEKEVMLPLDFTNIPAGKGYSSILPIKGGFAYSKADAGDLSNVQISLRLLDKKGNVVISEVETVNIQG
jgi:hypothetical protein